MGRWRWVLRLVGPIVLAALLATTDLRAVGDVLAGADPLGFAAALLIWVGITFVKAFRWRLLLTAQGIEVPYRLCVRWYMAGLFLGGVSPGRLGELVKVAFIRDLGHPMGHALFSSVVDRLFDLLVLPAVTVVGMALYGAVFTEEVPAVLAVLGVAAAGLVALWLGRRLLVVPVRVLMPRAVREQASLTVEGFLHEFARLRVCDWLRLGGITATCWVLYAASLALLAHGLDLAVAPAYVGIAVLTAALAGLAPITVSGVGTRDAVLSAFFARVGLGVHDAIALSTLVLGLNVAVVVAYFPAYLASTRSRPGPAGPR